MQKRNSFSDRFPLVEARHVLSSSQRIHVYTDLNSVWSSLELRGVKISPNANELSQIIDNLRPNLGVDLSYTSQIL